MGDDATMPRPLGALIKRRRTDLGLTQAELATRVGVANKTISAWETGLRTPDSPAALKRLATALEIAADTAAYTELRVAWDAAQARPAPLPDQPASGATTARPRHMARGWLMAGGVALVGLALSVIVVESRTSSSLHLLPGYVKSTASASMCAPVGCRIFQAHLTQVYQRNAQARQVYLISALPALGRSCTITPASVSAVITQCNACRVPRDDLSREYAFMIFTVDAAGTRGRRRVPGHYWLRVDYEATGRTGQSSGRGAPPPWAHPRTC